MIERSKVTDQLIDIFVKSINSGEWKAGEKIPSEHQLTERLGVSRASVRNAIQYLAALGILETRHGKGSFLLEERVDLHAASGSRITREDCNDMEKVLEFRLAVESECAYLAAARSTPELARRLERELEHMKNNARDGALFVKHDIRFHEILSKASGNTLLEKSLVSVFSEKLEDHHRMNALFGYEDGIRYHTEILKAVREGNAEAAHRAMRAHMLHAIGRLKRERLGS